VRHVDSKERARIVGGVSVEAYRPPIFPSSVLRLCVGTTPSLLHPYLDPINCRSTVRLCIHTDTHIVRILHVENDEPACRRS
jgi:hypothetical protein